MVAKAQPSVVGGLGGVSGFVPRNVADNEALEGFETREVLDELVEREVNEAWDVNPTEVEGFAPRGVLDELVKREVDEAWDVNPTEVEGFAPRDVLDDLVEREADE
ncbi:MAG: hypothetical protein Q9187_004275 [Circinaria calcarea]